MSIETIGNRIETVRPTKQTFAKLTIGALALVVILAIVSLLPAIDHVVPDLQQWVAILASGIIAMAIAGILVVLAPVLGRETTLAVDGPDQFTDDLGSIVYWGIILAAVLVLHRGFTPAAEAILDGWAILYDVMFLLVAIPPLLIVILRLHFCLDPLADRLTDRVSESAEQH